MADDSDGPTEALPVVDRVGFECDHIAAGGGVEDIVLAGREQDRAVVEFELGEPGRRLAVLDVNQTPD